jgi:GNAT superfamily N-acetyltransferase
LIKLFCNASLAQLSLLLLDLFEKEADFTPDQEKQLQGLRLILEKPSRGIIFVMRRGPLIIGMINLLTTISTAEGGFVLLLEDLVIHPDYRNQGYGRRLLDHAIAHARSSGFLRITLLTNRTEGAEGFYKKAGFVGSGMIPMRFHLKNEG